MNDMKVFENPQFGKVRSMMIKNEPWFVAADVCRVLDIKNNRDAIAKLDKDEKDVALTDTLGGQQQMVIVNEAGLYGLVLGSRKPEAKEFKRWITHDVIPSIRQSGMYMTPAAIQNILTDPANLLQIVTQWKEEHDKRLELEGQVQVLEPKAEYCDKVLKSEDLFTISQIAADFDMTGRALNKFLYEQRVQHRVGGQWILYAEHQGKGYTQSYTYALPSECGENRTAMLTKWTQAGRKFIRDLLVEQKII